MQALGFDGYRSFKYCLLRDRSGKSPKSPYFDHLGDFDLKPWDRLEGLPLKETRIAGRLLEDALKFLSADALSRAVRMLATARTIDIYGVENSVTPASDLLTKLTYLGLNCRMHTDAYLQQISAAHLGVADVAVAMNSGTQAAKEAGNMVDLDSSPTKLIEVVRIGKQLLMTRGALTTFSIANDIAKYFAIIPVLFAGIYPGLDALNFMRLSNPATAILSSIIYNALIIIALIPLALKGVKYREVPAGKLLSRNLLIYGLGGLAAPFIFIKLIDMLLVLFGLA